MQQLIIGKWYKFSPYTDISQVWYMKYSGGEYRASEYITDTGKYYGLVASGSFSEYNHKFPGTNDTYQEATAEEVNRVLPADKQIPVVQNQYQIY